MRKFLLLSMLAVLSAIGYAQSNDYWTVNNQSRSAIVTDKAVARLSFPKEYKLFNLDLASMRSELFTVVSNSQRHSTIISLPNADGNMEQFEVYEASNFAPELQARFPEIRAFSGKGITDKAATLKLSYSPQGIQTMVFRADGKASEYIEPYSQNHTVYAVFKSQRAKGGLPWVCSTPDADMATGLQKQVNSVVVPESSAGELKVIRLAQSCNGEYSNWFGATSSAQVALVLAAFNATLTRCNGCYEKDLALHLNLIPNTTAVIYYDPATDPYTTMGSWNGQLQATLTSVIGEANYDIGHMFGASGGGGNAGCIGCVCVDGQKGRGITSPADGIPQGDNFDIDYVVHEVGHQLGANHTFSMSLEGTGVNKEVGSGITIMGYAGITSYDVAPHSIDIYHEASIDQIQVNLATKTCPVTTSLAGVNATPVVAPLTPYTIPISTPFALTGSATDANPGDVLTYCWEQNDNSPVSGASSVASPTKVSGPNWLSFSPTTSPTRLFPKLATILAGSMVSGPLPGGDAVANTEALSSVSRTLNFRLTVRDNCPYSSTAPLKVGQTAFQDVLITVSNAAGPFKITSPNTTGISYPGGTQQTITWDVANTTAAPFNTANVKISFSTDGGQTFPTVLAASTPNDGTELLTIPVGVTSTARIKIESIGNIFFDINDANFAVSTPPSPTFSFSSFSTTTGCFGTTSVSGTLGTNSILGFSTPITLVASGNPAGTTVTFSPNPVTPGNTTTVTISSASPLAAGTFTFAVNGTAGAQSGTTNISYTINNPPAITTQPASATTCAGTSVTLSSAATGAGVTYQWMQSTTGCGGTFTNISGATSASYTVSAPTAGMNGYAYQVVVSGACSPSVTSNCATLTINPATAVGTQPVDQTVCAGSTATFTTTASGASVGYQWQVSTDNGSTWTNISGATAASYTTAATTFAMNGYKYREIVTGSCGTATSNVATLTVNQTTSISSQPAASAICSGTTTSFSTTAVGTNVTYQWQVSATGCAGTFANVSTGTGGTTATYTTPATTPTMNGYAYRVVVTGTCGAAVTSNCAALTVYTTAIINTQPADQSACVGNTATFTAAAVGSGVTYQWQVSTDGGTTWAPISGATSASYTVTAAQGMNGYKYRVWVSSTCNTAGAASSVATLTVNNPVTIVTNPVATRGCVGGTATFNVSATGTGLSYQWQMATSASGPFTNLPAQTDATMNLWNLPLSLNGNWFQVVVTGNPCGQRTSTPVQLIVGEIPAITLSADRTAILPNTPATLSATINPSGTYTYQWYRNGVVVAGQTGATLSVNVDNLGEYKLVATNTTTGCSGTSNFLRIGASKSDILFIYPNPNAGTFVVRYYDATENRRRTLNIYDSRGSRVYAQTLTNAGPYQRIDVRLLNVQSGVYYVELREYYSGAKIATGKVKVIK